MRRMATNWTRRTFLIRSGATAGAVVLGGAACSSSDDGAGGDDATDGAADDAQGDEMSADGVVNLSDVPTEGTIFGWISEVFDQGIRRPGYPADEWAEGWIADQFRRIGLDNVRQEPIAVTRWEPTDWSLEVIGPDGETTYIDCFPVPFSAPVDGLEAEVSAFDQASPDSVRDKASLFDVPLIRIPADLLATAGSAPADPAGRIVDPDGSLTGAQHIVPFGAQFQEVMEPSIDAGAAAFIGTLTDYPGDSFNYFVPYDAIARPIPGVWVNGTDGAWLRDQLARGPVRVRLTVASCKGHRHRGSTTGPRSQGCMVIPAGPGVASRSSLGEVREGLAPLI
jgi:hypothetical protein